MLVVKFKSIFVEVSSIVAGVLIALAVNEWNENRVKQARVEEALENIAQEIARNTQLLEFIHQKNLEVIAGFENSAEHAQKNQQYIPGLQLQKTAWETTLNTGVSEFIDYKTLYGIAEVYSLQDIYKSLAYQFVQTIMTAKVTGVKRQLDLAKIDDKELYGDNIAMLVMNEQAILEQYKDALSMLRKRGVKIKAEQVNVSRAD